MPCRLLVNGSWRQVKRRTEPKGQKKAHWVELENQRGVKQQKEPEKDQRSGVASGAVSPRSHRAVVAPSASRKESVAVAASSAVSSRAMPSSSSAASLRAAYDAAEQAAQVAYDEYFAAQEKEETAENKALL